MELRFGTRGSGENNTDGWGLVVEDAFSHGAFLWGALMEWDGKIMRAEKHVFKDRHEDS